jgi:cytochrome c553
MTHGVKTSRCLFIQFTQSHKHTSTIPATRGQLKFSSALGSEPVQCIRCHVSADSGELYYPQWHLLLQTEYNAQLPADQFKISAM